MFYTIGNLMSHFFGDDAVFGGKAIFGREAVFGEEAALAEREAVSSCTLSDPFIVKTLGADNEHFIDFFKSSSRSPANQGLVSERQN